MSQVNFLGINTVKLRYAMSSNLSSITSDEFSQQWTSARYPHFIGECFDKFSLFFCVPIVQILTEQTIESAVNDSTDRLPLNQGNCQNSHCFSY
jgi:hypothetical protein